MKPTFISIEKAGTKMRAISGPLQGEFRSGESWNAAAGQTYGFLVFRQ